MWFNPCRNQSELVSKPCPTVHPDKCDHPLASEAFDAVKKAHQARRRCKL